LASARPVILEKPIILIMIVWWKQNWKIKKIVRVDKISVKRNWVRYGNIAQDRKIKDLTIRIRKAAALLSKLLRNLFILVYDMSV
jgi:hypothetical protein